MIKITTPRKKKEGKDNEESESQKKLSQVATYSIKKVAISEEKKIIYHNFICYLFVLFQIGNSLVLFFLSSTCHWYP